MQWTDERVTELARLWEQGLTTAEIGRALDVSKNAVVGKAHRMGLAARPSPIKRKEEELAQARADAGSESDPDASGRARDDDSPRAAGPAAASAKGGAQAAGAGGRASSKAAKVKGKSVVDLNAMTCRWPIGDPRDSDFHFCGKGTVGDKPYCAEHAGIAYVRQNKGSRAAANEDAA